MDTSLAIIPNAVRDACRGVVSDFDDTITWHGPIVPEAYAALCRARAAGKRLIIATGRPAGWAHVLLQHFPIDAAIAEGGAVAFYRDAQGKACEVFWQTEAELAQARAQLEAAKQLAFRAVPHARLSQDSWLRRCDVAFDVNETQNLTGEDVARLAECAVAGGVHFSQSSIHAHYSVGNYDKAAMAERVAALMWQETAANLRAHYVFAGDSPNDQSGFAYFDCSVGMANVRKYLADLQSPPRFIMTQEGGHGFAELVKQLL